MIRKYHNRTMQNNSRHRRVEPHTFTATRHCKTLLQNIAYTLFDMIGEIKGPLLYCFRFEIILNSWLLSQKCCQRERTSLRDGLRLPSNCALNMIRRQLLYVMKPEGSFYMCIKFQPKLPTQ